MPNVTLIQYVYELQIYLDRISTYTDELLRD